MFKQTTFLALPFLYGINAQAGFLPENDLDLEDSFAETNVTEDEFNAILDRAEGIYRHVIDQYGAELVVERRWKSSTVNAYANQNGKKWKIVVFGGLARRPEVTKDGFAMVVCHELGHHLGGYPFYPRVNEWAASEGQSDYFAAQVCARKLWKEDYIENAKYRDEASDYIIERCDDSWPFQSDRDLCYRIAVGAISLGELLAYLRDTTVDIETPDTTVVDQTIFDGYPDAQCRLDTMFSGALCRVTSEQNVIPGREAVAGQNGIIAETWAAANSCMPASAWIGIEDVNEDGRRPTCWFQNQLDEQGHPIAD